MSDPQIRSAWLMLGILLAVFAVDGWLVWCGERATFSETARALGQRWPAFTIMLSFGVGLLLGHFFLGQS